MTADDLQNLLLSLDHHIEDATNACQQGSHEVVRASLTDMDEILDKLITLLPPEQQQAFAKEEQPFPEAQSMAESIERSVASDIPQDMMGQDDERQVDPRCIGKITDFMNRLGD